MAMFFSELFLVGKDALHDSTFTPIFADKSPKLWLLLRFCNNRLNDRQKSCALKIHR